MGEGGLRQIGTQGFLPWSGLVGPVQENISLPWSSYSGTREHFPYCPELPPSP